METREDGDVVKRPWLRVMIRGIPKEGWKHFPQGQPFGGYGLKVMIRGIPKEGWKPNGSVLRATSDPYRDDQRNP